MKNFNFMNYFMHSVLPKGALCLALVAGALMMLALTSTPALAQGVTGSISGTVKDSQGGVIPGVSVTIVSATRGTRLAPVLTNDVGEFIAPNLLADTYNVEAELSGFKKLERAGITVNPGSRAEIGTLTLEVGGMTEVVTVVGDASPIQLSSGERSFTLAASTVQALPISSRNFINLINQEAGIDGGNRVGGGGGNNYQIDGVTAMETGANRLVTRVSSEAVGEVRVATSSYQAEYGRSSGLQINATTKSGTNEFHGTFYWYRNDSRWAEKSKTATLNGDPKSQSLTNDWGWTIGGPIGKPKGDNKLFFFFNQEFNPRTSANAVTRYRVPSLLERAGDFSQTLDNNGNLYPYIKDPLVAGTCSSSNQTACFKYQGVLGKIDPARFYQPGVNILKWWPEPNIAMPLGQTYNYEARRDELKLLGYQPVIRMDYQPMPKLGISGKFYEYQQPNDPIPGTIPGWNDTVMDNYGIWMGSATVNWAANPTTFVEGSWGGNWHHQEGCSIYGGEPNFCTSGLRINDAANRNKAGMGDIPYIFPDANIINKDYFAYGILNKVKPSYWNATTGRIEKTPDFSWGSRITNTPPSQGFVGFILNTTASNWSVTASKISGSHTLKAGLYRFKNFGPRGSGAAFGSINFGNTSGNPLDTSYGFSNAILGVFSDYSQVSRWTEGQWTTLNVEWFLQDSWRLKSNFTLELGLRFVYQQPQFDPLKQSANFLPDRWKAADAPQLYVAGCVTGVYPCTSSNLQAKNPVTGQFLGPNTSLAIGTVIPNTGNETNGLFVAGQGIADTYYTWPKLALAPRGGFAWNIGGKQTFVVRGGFGMFFDRPDGNSVYGLSNNPPGAKSVTVRYGFLQNMSSSGLTTYAPPALSTFQYESGLPTSVQWNGGIQMKTPFNTTLDVAYTGQHSYNQLQSENLNSIDMGTAFLEAYRDPTSSSTVLGSWSYVNTFSALVRPVRGYANISMRNATGWQTFQSVQISFNRRFRGGFGFGVNDTISLYNHAYVAPRWEHTGPMTTKLRADQEKANELFGTGVDNRHRMRANFTWQVPQLRSSQSALKAIAMVANGWQVAGTWGTTTPSWYTIGYSYANNGSAYNLTGSPDFSSRIKVVGDPGSGCSDDSYKQFNTAAFAGPVQGSDGLESGEQYMKGCRSYSFDLSISRTIKLWETSSIQLRIDMFNALNLNQISGRNTTMNLASPTTNTTVTNLPYDSAGNLIVSRSQPKNAGFGVVSGYQGPRTIQAQLRFAF